MEVKLCPYCMQMTFGDFCNNCKKPVNYEGKPLQLPVGTELHGYHDYLVGAALGQGGFGVTYLALDTTTNKRVALKEFFPVHCSGRTEKITVIAYDGQDDDFEKGKQRFLLEAQTLQQLEEVEAVVKVYDCFQANNTIYLVMEYVDGQSLKTYLDEHGAIPPETFFPLVKPLLENVAMMHRQGVIHRDIAPDNIILATDGRLRLIDFGTAREYMGEASMTVVVKKGFAPVEQYTRRGQSAATDVYALAATIYYCITGQVAPDSMDRFDNDTLKRPSELGVKLPKYQEDALIRAMAVRAADRTQTVDELLADLFTEKAAPKPEPKPETKSIPKTEPPVKPKPIPKTEPQVKPKPIPKTEPQVKSIPKTVPAPAPKPTPAASGNSTKKKSPVWIGIVAVIALAVVGILFAVSGGKDTPEMKPEMKAEPKVTTAVTEAPRETVPETEPVPTFVPIRNVSDHAYAYSDDAADDSCYTADEFAELVKYDNVEEYLPLGTKVKMTPNSSEIADEAIEFELVAYRHFRLADGSGMAKTTWLAVNLLNEGRQMNYTQRNAGGWPESDLRSWMNDTLYPSLPSFWKTLMENVQVSSRDGANPTEILTSDDYLFIPAVGEVDAGRLSDNYEREIDEEAEEQTFSCFTENDSRVKSINGAASTWWSRSPYPYNIEYGGHWVQDYFWPYNKVWESTKIGSTVQFSCIRGGGESNCAFANESVGVCLAFCM